MPVPFAAALSVSVLLPKLPVLQRWDRGLLAWVREKANIPGEVQELAHRLQPETLVLTPQHVAQLREFIDRDDRLPNSLAAHLRDSKGMGFEQSQYCFTRVLHLYAFLKRLSGQARFGRFFRERDAQFGRIEADFSSFAARSEALLTLAREVGSYEDRPEFARVLAERRDVYKQECVAAFKPVANLTAYALLRVEATDDGLATRLREIGFASEAASRSVFPINELSLLAVALLTLFLVVGSPLAPELFPVIPGGPPASGSEAVGAFIVFTHVLTTLATVCVVQRIHPFRGGQGRGVPVFACLCWTLLCSASVWLTCNAAAAGAGPDAPFIWPVTVLNGVLTLVLAYFCCGGLTRMVGGRWLQLAEAAAAGAAMALAGWVVAWGQDLATITPADQLSRLYAVTVCLPGVVGLLMGGFVPRIVRLAQAATKQEGPGSASPSPMWGNQVGAGAMQHPVR